MSLNTFDKTQTQYERKKARQAQLDMMEAAASGQAFASTPSITVTTTSTQGSTTASLSNSVHSHSSNNNAPDGTMENARRFLWDEDAQEHGQLVGSGGYADSKLSGGSGITGRIMGSLPRFSAKTGMEDDPNMVNLAPRESGSHSSPRGGVWADASPNTADSEEFIDHRGRGGGGGFISGIGDCCVAIFQTIIGMCALLMEYMTSCCAGCNRRLFLFVVVGCIAIGLIIFAIVAIVHRTSGGGGGESSTPTSPTVPTIDSILDEPRYKEIRSNILESTFTSQAMLETKGTAQNLALRWITDYDPSQISTDDDMLLQRYALAVFYFSTQLNTNMQDENGDGAWDKMDNWMSDKGICLWYGISCPPHLKEGVEEVHYNENSDVIKLNLTNNGVEGTIPSELQALENLETLDLGKNLISGTIPPELGNLMLMSK
jgi:hypothetical protein